MKILWDSVEAKEAIRKAVSTVNRYTLSQNFNSLVQKISEKQRINIRNILVTSGSTEAIRGSINTFGLSNKNSQLIVPSLTYTDGEDSAKQIKIPVSKIPMSKDWQIDLEQLKKTVAESKGFSIVYIVNPNNPTGSIVSCAQLNSWIESRPENTLFIIDEAYSDFVVDPSFISAVSLVQKGLDNVIVTKTFSKIFALAGLRIGYAVAHERLLNQIKGFVSSGILLNKLGVVVATASLTDINFLKLSKQENLLSKQILLKTFDRLANSIFADRSEFYLFQAPADCSG